jgi:hypothetical protein
MSERACRAQTKQGANCRAPALPGYETCLSHTPELAEKVRLARMRGGSAAAKVRVLQGRRLKLDSSQALVRFLGDVAQDTLSGAIDPNVSRATVYAVATLRATLETADLEQRLAALEAAAGQTRRFT